MVIGLAPSQAPPGHSESGEELTAMHTDCFIKSEVMFVCCVVLYGKYFWAQSFLNNSFFNLHYTVPGSLPLRKCYAFIRSVRVQRRSVRVHSEAQLGAELPRARIFKRLWSLRIDSIEPIPPDCVAWRAGMTTLFLLGSYPP